MAYDDDLRRWETAGLIEAAQAARIREFEAERAAPAAPAGPSAVARLEVTLTEVVAYAGSIAILVGLGFLLGFQGQQLGAPGRLAIYVLVAAAAFGVGFLLAPGSGRPPVRRARASALLLGVGATFAVAAEGFNDLRLLNPSGDLMLGGLAAAAVAAPLFWRFRFLVLGLATAAAAYTATANYVDWRQGGEPWTNEAAYCAAGALLVVVAELVRRRGAGRWAIELVAFAALAPPALAAVKFAPDGQAGLGLVLAAGAIATLASIAALLRRSPGYAVAAGLGLFVYAAAVATHFFGQPWALVLILAGAAVPLAHAERLRLLGRTGGATEVYRFAAALAPVAFGLPLVPTSDGRLPALAIIGLLAAAASVAAAWRHSSGFAVGAGIGIAAFTVAVPALLSSQPWPAALLIAAASAVVLFHVERFRELGRRGGWLEVLAFLGLITPIGFGLSLASGPEQVAFELLAGAVAVAGFGAAVARSSRGYAVAGGVGLFAFTMTVGLRHFTGSIGFAGVLVSAGLVLIGLAFVLARLLPRLRGRSRPEVASAGGA